MTSSALATPVVSVGTVVANTDVLPLPFGADADLTDFTAYCISPCADGVESDPVPLPLYVTALYTCARPAGAPLPASLTPGVSEPASPWPCGPQVLPVQGCGGAAGCAGSVALSAAAWRCKGLALCAQPPVPWACGVGGVPWFPTEPGCYL